MATFRKLRYRKVSEGIRDLKEKIKMNFAKSGLTVYDRNALKQRLGFITMFDEKLYREFSNKYITFIRTTLNVDVTSCLDYILSQWEKTCMEQGPGTAVKLFKELYSASLRISTSNEFQPISFRKSNSLGEPKILGPLIKLLHGTLDERRAAISVLSIIKLVKYEDPNFSTETITKEGPIPPKDLLERVKVGSYFNRFIEIKGNICNGIDVTELKRCYFNELEKAFPNRFDDKRLQEISSLSDIHISGRNGPNGPCLSTAVIDLAALSDDPRGTRLLTAIYEFAVLTENGELLRLIDNFIEKP